MDIARTEGQIRSINAGKAELAAKNIKEPEKGASEQEWADYNTALKETASYKETQRKWGTGSDIQCGLQAATGVLQGLACGDIAAAIAGGTAPYMTQQIKKQVGEDNRAANAVAHALLGGVVAELQGRSAGAGAAGAAVNSAVSAAQAASSESDDRLAALKGTQAAMSGYQASQALQLDAANGGDPANSNTIGISASIGSQSSESRSHSEQNKAAGSTLTAGDNVAITATGGDITAIGSQIKAGQDVVLNAADDINLISSQNSQLLEGDNSSSGGSLGVGVGVGSGGMGISISASGNSAKGNESGSGTTHNEATLDAGRQVTLTSGDDTTLAGAQLSGNKVVAGMGGDLTISNQQDSDRYDSKQSGVSGGGSFTFGTMTGSGGVSFSRDKMRSEYDSVI